MLQMTNGQIVEDYNTITTAQLPQTQTVGNVSFGGAMLGQLSNCIDYGQYRWPYQTYWNSYPVYVCTDKTKKAIEVLKTLQAEKLLKCDSVPRFIELVEKISNIL